MALLKCKYHPSALRIKEFVGENISEFYFATTTIENIENEIKKLNFSKKRNLLKYFANIWNGGILKEIQNCILCIILVWSLFCLCRSAFSTITFGQLVFVFLCFLCFLF